VKIGYGMFKLKFKFALWCTVLDYYNIMKPMEVSLKRIKIFFKIEFCALLFRRKFIKNIISYTQFSPYESNSVALLV